ncbi:hypothetical protein Clacol_005003 [Clathrus columnatus]|uniref:F-box domain-containing protein n=1 Tax=Clathrus columnatus TaxID=1419009 RepID=A0AAV5ACY9_9AGAM|nr:hypothetical protein Clacol_005003 [Clathrus columnatus]
MVVQLDEGAIVNGVSSHTTYDTRIQMPSEILNEKREKLSNYLALLDKCHNSQLPINKLPLGVLERVFILTVFTSSFPGTATLDISHVCHYWRRLALERPNLWGFVDFGSRRLSALFLKRSEDASITLSYSARHPLFERPAPRYINFDSLTKRRFESYAGLFPRLDTLNLHFSFHMFKQIHHLFRSSERLRLRSLDICLTDMDPMYIDWFKLFSTDTAYLRELTIRELSLPWPIPPHQKLTRLSIIRPHILPTATQLLTFLSHCQALNELRLILSDSARTVTGRVQPHVSDISDVASLTFEKLDFYHLTILELRANDIPSYECIRSVSSYIHTHTRLSSFRMGYECLPPTLETTCQSSSIFELAPTSVLEHFKDCQFFSLHLDFAINRSSINADRAIPESNKPRKTPFPGFTDPFVFSLSGRCGQPGRLFDHLSIVNLIRGMSNIRYLQLISPAWELITSWNINFSVLFPCLTTLELCDQSQPPRDCTTYLTALLSLPNLKLRTLVLRNVQIDSSVLPDVAAGTELGVLKLSECLVDPEVIVFLQERGVEVIVDDEEVSTVSNFTNTSPPLYSPIIFCVTPSVDVHLVVAYESDDTEKMRLLHSDVDLTGDQYEKPGDIPATLWSYESFGQALRQMADLFRSLSTMQNLRIMTGFQFGQRGWDEDCPDEYRNAREEGDNITAVIFDYLDARLPRLELCASRSSIIKRVGACKCWKWKRALPGEIFSETKYDFPIPEEHDLLVS